MDKLSKMTTETLTQMIGNENIFLNFSKSLKSTISKAVDVYGENAKELVTIALIATSCGMVNAQDIQARDTMLLGGVAAGMIANGEKPSDIPTDCDVKGTNGLSVATGSMVGTAIGSNLGKGSGNTAFTILGGALGGVIAKAGENERMRAECAKQLGQYPGYSQNGSLSSSTILYQGVSQNGSPVYVTVQSSPGIAGLTGKIKGPNNVEDNDLIKSALDRSSVALVQSYDKLDIAAHKYIDVVRGKTTVGQSARYAVNDMEAAKGSATQQAQAVKLKEAELSFNYAYTEFAKKRSYFSNAADRAVEDGYNISGYAAALPYIKSPQSVDVAYAGSTQYNPYAVLQTTIKQQVKMR
jgi:hypothetical protein